MSRGNTGRLSPHRTYFRDTSPQIDKNNSPKKEDTMPKLGIPDDYREEFNKYKLELLQKNSKGLLIDMEPVENE